MSEGTLYYLFNILNLVFLLIGKKSSHYVSGASFCPRRPETLIQPEESKVHSVQEVEFTKTECFQNVMQVTRPTTSRTHSCKPLVLFDHHFLLSSRYECLPPCRQTVCFDIRQTLFCRHYALSPLQL
jgi:hypothetical protein